MLFEATFNVSNGEITDMITTPHTDYEVFEMDAEMAIVRFRSWTVPCVMCKSTCHVYRAEGLTTVNMGEYGLKIMEWYQV